MNRAREIRVIKAKKQGNMSGKIRVAAYCRVSTDSSDQLNSFYAQVKYYTDYIRNNEDMRLVDIYADEGITGTSIEKRDDFKRLVADVKQKKIDRVLVKSVTRFARNSLECVETVRLFKANGASIYFENDNIDTDRMNSEMILYLKSAFSQGEALSASRRMAVSNRTKMADGTYNLASAPFGYRLSENGLVVEPQEAEMVKKIFGLYLSGMGDCLITQYMKEHYPEKFWSLRGINYILINERYIGDCLLQKFYSPLTLPLTLKKNSGELPKYYYSGTHEAIITKEDFDRVQKLRSERKSRYQSGIQKQKTDKTECFKKKVYCRHCGWACKTITFKGGLYWRCHKQGTTSDECRTLSRSDKLLRQAFIKMFNTLKQNNRTIIHETVLQLQALKLKASGGREEIIEIDKELSSLTEQNRIYTELFAQQILDEVLYYEQTDVLKKQITELRSRRLKILNDDEDENCIEQLRGLERIVEENNFITDFDEKLFHNITDRIYIEENGELTFLLKCGLELRVNMEDGI